MNKVSFSAFFLCGILLLFSTYANAELEEENTPNPAISPQSQEKLNNKDLPLEISEKFYKKEAILKFNEAVKSWELKKIDEAIDFWTDSLKVDPNLWTSYLGLGQAYENIKEYGKSLEAYKSYLAIAPGNAPDRSSIEETVKYLNHLLEHGEEILTGDNYLAAMKTKHEGKMLYTRWNLKKPLKIYFYPADNVPNYRREYQDAFLSGAIIWQQALPDLKFEVITSTSFEKLSAKEAKAKEKEASESANIKVVFPSRFKVKGDENNQIAPQIEAQSFPIIRDKTNFRVAGVIMISPYVYHQAQIAIPLEPLAKLKPNVQINRLKIIAAREVGHVLGLWGFSPNPDDIMFEGSVKTFKLSERDINTMRDLYDLNPNEEEILTNL